MIIKNNKLTIGLIFIIFLLLNTVSTSGASVPWREGDLYSYTNNIKNEMTSNKLDSDINSNLIVSQESVIEFTIDNIDETDELIDLEFARSSGELYVIKGVSYNATNFGNQLFLFFISENNGHYEGFSIYLNNIYFINPDNFDTLNEQAKLNYEEILKENIDNTTTYEDFFDKADSLNFMGAKSAAEAVDKFTDDRYEWSFEIDLSSVMEYSESSNYFNDSIGTDKWYSYDKYIVKTSLKFDKDGVLQSYSFYSETSITTDEFEINTKSENGVYNGSGAIASLTAPGFEIYTVLSIFIVIPLINKFKKEELL